MQMNACATLYMCKTIRYYHSFSHMTEAWLDYMFFIQPEPHTEWLIIWYEE